MLSTLYPPSNNPLSSVLFIVLKTFTNTFTDTYSRKSHILTKWRNVTYIYALYIIDLRGCKKYILAQSRSLIFSTRYSVMCKVYTGCHGTSEIEHGLCACTVSNQSPNGSTNQALSLTNKLLKLFDSVSASNSICRELQWPKWLTFHFHTTSQFRILNSEFRNLHCEFRNSELWSICSMGK